MRCQTRMPETQCALLLVALPGEPQERVYNRYALDLRGSVGYCLRSEMGFCAIGVE